MSAMTKSLDIIHQVPKHPLNKTDSYSFKKGERIGFK
jgi:hypothetical protein